MESIAEKSLQYDIYTIPVVKPLNQQQLCELSARYQQILVIEENQKSGGIGSAVIESLSDAYNEQMIPVYPRIKRIAINDEFLDEAGSQRYLQDKAGLVL
jgi:transketolase